MSFKIVRDGVFDEGGVTEILRGSRNLADNISDLRAQVRLRSIPKNVMQIAALSVVRWHQIRKAVVLFWI